NQREHFFLHPLIFSCFPHKDCLLLLSMLLKSVYILGIQVLLLTNIGLTHRVSLLCMVKVWFVFHPHNAIPNVCQVRFYILHLISSLRVDHNVLVLLPLLLKCYANHFSALINFVSLCLSFGLFHKKNVLIHAHNWFSLRLMLLVFSYPSVRYNSHHFQPQCMVYAYFLFQQLQNEYGYV
ncbi:Hypothetical protein EfmE4453_2654, partial [Enterococcus faecium E4453]